MSTRASRRLTRADRSDTDARTIAFRAPRGLASPFARAVSCIMMPTRLARRKTVLPAALLLFAAAGFRVNAGNAPQNRSAQPPKTLRLYVFHCGVINVNRAGTERYKVTPEEVGETRFSVPCFLVAHPKGTLLWDLGIVPDDTVEARARGEQGNATATPPAVAVVPRTLKSQLAEVGYRPEDITYFAFSHAHVDHNANANQFAASTWLARPAERAFMWEDDNTRVNRTFFETASPSASTVMSTTSFPISRSSSSPHRVTHRAIRY
jgi:Metallo-beta-lactamase superfamily